MGFAGCDCAPSVWLNSANVPPNQVHLFNPTGTDPIRRNLDVRKCFGFVAASRRVMRGLEAAGPV